jgi:hypothetical protein
VKRFLLVRGVIALHAKSAEASGIKSGTPNANEEVEGIFHQKMARDPKLFVVSKIR